MTSMKAAVWTGTDQVEATDLPMPQVPDGWALVKVAYNGICGTDLASATASTPGRARR
jgi:threonine dehydrogenase-like Zn-dependent dehydrogenase